MRWDSIEDKKCVLVLKVDFICFACLRSAAQAAASHLAEALAR